MKEIILEKSPDNLNGLLKDQVLEEIKIKLKDRVIHAYVYGSFLTKDFSRESDIDLIIIKNVKTPFVERGFEFFDLRDWLPAIEILVYTPAEFESLTKNPSAGFWQSVVSSMRRII
ncbi:MAG: nucleotidyltransferase domain-containing protein [Spirochaetia bacterium]|nr:nucleotidyltransferase domain-containing protein [Spirochaetia bacterium]